MSEKEIKKTKERIDHIELWLKRYAYRFTRVEYLMKKAEIDNQPEYIKHLMKTRNNYLSSIRYTAKLLARLKGELKQNGKS